MDPLTLGIGAIGLGLKLWGGANASSDASQIANVSGQNAALEGQVNNQKAMAMQLSSHRQVIEDYRNTQRARSMGVNASVNQGAQYGSGAAGGAAQALDTGLFNTQGVNQQAQIGGNIFALNSQESGNNITIAGLKGQQATAEGMSNLGGSLFGAAQTLGNMGKSAGGIASSAGMSVPGGSGSGMFFNNSSWKFG